MKKKRYRRIFIILAIIVLLIAGAIAIFGYKSNEGFEKLAEAKIENVDMSTIQDGDYLGEYNVFPITVELKVTVENHQMKDIEILKHVNGQGGSAEAIVDTVIQTQSLNVDAVSGATYSSKVILKAIEAALHGENRENVE